MSNKMGEIPNSPNPIDRFATSMQAYRIDFLMNKQRERKERERAKEMSRLRWYVLRRQSGLTDLSYDEYMAWVNERELSNHIP